MHDLNNTGVLNRIFCSSSVSSSDGAVSVKKIEKRAAPKINISVEDRAKINLEWRKEVEKNDSTGN